MWCRRPSVRPDKRPLRTARPLRIFNTSRFSLAALALSEAGSVGFEVDTDRIYLTLQELTGRIRLLRLATRESDGG